mmetsp:Transcript_10550/g.14883  ORF Transcript_10550/g.14883 Transcript_10550/m.14883 type:complete len:382 (+) Transcript_10550:125-1270(+)
MRSVAARTINELFLDNLFQMSMTYHGGIEMITYEWGASSIPSFKVSPDDKAQDVIAQGMSRYAGELRKASDLYRTGDMNSILYPVHGGFEDYAYAGSWGNSYLPNYLQGKCQPDTYGGYPLEKTNYDDTTLRSFNFLVEISEKHNYDTNKFYGTDLGLFQPPFSHDNLNNNGFVSKHIRTALMAIDIVQPYVEIVKFQSKLFGNEIKPLTLLKKRSKNVKIRKKPVKISWKVGGSFTVDKTKLFYSKWSDLPKYFDGTKQVKHSQIKKIFKNNLQTTYFSGTQKGFTRWSESGESIFTEEIDLSMFQTGDDIAVYAIAMVDQEWKKQNKRNIWPLVDPQSHMVQSRTNIKWKHSKIIGGETKNVIGRKYWISIPLKIKIRS